MANYAYSGTTTSLDYNTLSYRGVTDVMGAMQRQYEQRYRELEWNTRQMMNNHQMFVSSLTTAQVKSPVDEKKVSQKAEKLRNLIAYYYHRK